MNSSDFSALSLFAVVAREQSFTAAAQALGISNSAASYTIRRLEQQLGTKLFNRTTRSVSLTEAGSAFLTRIQPLMARHSTSTTTTRAACRANYACSSTSRASICNSAGSAMQSNPRGSPLLHGADSRQTSRSRRPGCNALPRPTRPSILKAR
jgi:molybdenum-dependent DNA-binding transcriptional regulator ModE